jgi:hypothetical protein
MDRQSCFVVETELNPAKRALTLTAKHQGRFTE